MQYTDEALQITTCRPRMLTSLAIFADARRPSYSLVALPTRNARSVSIHLGIVLLHMPRLA